jgi:hypothetical protein
VPKVSGSAALAGAPVFGLRGIFAGFPSLRGAPSCQAHQREKCCFSFSILFGRLCASYYLLLLLAELTTHRAHTGISSAITPALITALPTIIRP